MNCHNDDKFSKWSIFRVSVGWNCTNVVLFYGYFTLTVYFVLQYEHIKSRTRNTHLNQGFSLQLTFNRNISHIVNWFAVYRQDLPQPKDASSCGVFVAWYNYCNIQSFSLKCPQHHFLGTSSYQHLTLCVMHDNYNPTPHPDSCTEIREVCMPHILKTQHLFVLMAIMLKIFHHQLLNMNMFCFSIVNLLIYHNHCLRYFISSTTHAHIFCCV